MIDTMQAVGNETTARGARAKTWRRVAVAFALAGTALLSAACGSSGGSGNHSTTTTSQSGFGY